MPRKQTKTSSSTTGAKPPKIDPNSPRAQIDREERELAEKRNAENKALYDDVRAVMGPAKPKGTVRKSASRRPLNEIEIQREQTRRALRLSRAVEEQKRDDMMRKPERMVVTGFASPTGGKLAKQTLAYLNSMQAVSGVRLGWSSHPHNRYRTEFNLAHLTDSQRDQLKALFGVVASSVSWSRQIALFKAWDDDRRRTFKRRWAPAKSENAIDPVQGVLGKALRVGSNTVEIVESTEYDPDGRNNDGTQYLRTRLLRMTASDGTELKTMVVGLTMEIPVGHGGALFIDAGLSREAAVEMMKNLATRPVGQPAPEATISRLPQRPPAVVEWR